jgi:regulator of protease activity HflC (stomatin/prohibitin superfamily)
MALVETGYRVAVRWDTATTNGREQAVKTDPYNNVESEPRRAASAKFVLQQDEDTTQDLKEAMNTAHRSLTASLQLSFRALQAIMVVLIVLYLVSGFRTVEDSETGVATFFGSIIGDEGLAPGLQTNWPPPIGSFEIYVSHNRSTDIGGVFKPRIDARLSHEQRIIKSKSSDGLRPGRDGSLITSDGDLAHIEIAAEWEIIDSLQYANSIADVNGDEIVQLALERSAVHIVGQITLEELLDTPLDELRSLLQIEAQNTLNQLLCGIRISDVILPSEPEPPLYIQRSYDAFDSARINADTSVERATAKAHETLIEAAGSNYAKLLTHIELYEHAAEIRDADAMQESLEHINAFIHSDDISGKVANKISMAEGYRAQVETTLGQDYRRFQSLLPAYRDHPELVIRNKWLNTYASILGKADVETVFVPELISMIRLGITGSDTIAQLRHRNQLKKKESSALLKDNDLLNPWILRARDIRMDEPSRELSITGGTVRGRN